MNQTTLNIDTPQKSLAERGARGRIIHGDCVEVMRKMPDESFKVIVTSPPYNLLNSTGGGGKNPGHNSKWDMGDLKNGYDNHDDTMPHEEYVAWQRECLNEMFRLLRPDGAIFYNHKWRVQDGLLQDRADIVDGFPVRQVIIWHRPGAINSAMTFFLQNYEVIYLIVKSRFLLNTWAKAKGCVWKFNHARNNPHPAPFPVELPRRCIEAVGEGPVLDPFMGSGTTAIAAEQLGMQWTGIEKSKKYVDMAEARVSAYLAMGN